MKVMNGSLSLQEERKELEEVNHLESPGEKLLSIDYHSQPYCFKHSLTDRKMVREFSPFDKF